MAKSDRIDLPFICPFTIADCYARGALVVEVPLMEEGDKLGSATQCYTVCDGVPFLYPYTTGGQPREEFYNDHYAGRDRTTEVTTAYLSSERQQLSEFVRRHGIRGPSLEVGCGTGLCAALVPRYVGLEFSKSALFAKGFETFKRFGGSAEAIPLTKGSVELVFSFNVLEHVPQADQAFAEIHRVLKPGGYVFLKPAWNTSTIQTKLLIERGYAELAWADKCHKFIVPLLRSTMYKAADRLPRRLFWFFYHAIRLRFSAGPVALRFRKISPWLGESPVHIPDSDACSQIDVFAAMQFFTSRGYELLSHPHLLQQICSGHDILVARKPF